MNSAPPSTWQICVKIDLAGRKATILDLYFREGKKMFEGPTADSDFLVTTTSTSFSRVITVVF
jgi:hypothetical protein